MDENYFKLKMQLHSESQEAEDTLEPTGEEEPKVEPTQDTEPKTDTEQVEGDDPASTGGKGVPTPGETPEVPDETKVGEILTAKGINFENLQKEYDVDGQLSSRTYESLASAGFPKEVVDNYIYGVEAKVNAFSNAVYDTVGGKGKYEEVTKFVATQGQDAVDAFNAAIQSSNMSLIKNYLSNVQQTMVAQRGTNNPTILGGSSSSKGTKGYADINAMTKAMSDKRYGRDEAYTASVRAKLEKSSSLFDSK